ncbi:MAG TPA: 16S rRNA (cytidine(1402)-2'-O)-methyltransferase [Polyangiaceae bacterium]|nr:16S rRNA (cytidine(1402)-2'-O)-methyltransferase [Polyangiaceae bacterium]
MAGTLYLVATPIGNLQDITLRALETLRAASLIAAEDTRRTRALLTHFAISGKHVVACNAHASPEELAGLVERLRAGENVALVTDAGTPSVSDPGTPLVRSAVAAGIGVVPIPGVSAVTTAVAASGLVDGPFRFVGFLPSKTSRRSALLSEVALSREPCVLFEAPHRIAETLRDLATLAPEREAVVCRELTKLHEELLRGSLATLAAKAESAPLRGEITLVVAAAPESELKAPLDEAAIDESILSGLRAGESPRSVVEALAAACPMPRRELYRRVTELAQKLSAEAVDE